MANPLKIKATGGGAFLGLQQMQTSEMDYAVHKVLDAFVVNTLDAGTINVNVSGANRGAFSDTVRTEAVGFHPSQNALSTNLYTLYQNTTSASESSMVYPLFVNATSYASEHSNDLTSSIITAALSNLVSNGLGSYWMSATNPNSSLYTDTGYFVKNTANSGTVTTYTLWRKTQGVSAPTTVRPVRLNGTSIKEMTDAEIQLLVARFRNSITGTGIGSYKLAASNPSGGGQVWQQVSDDLVDTRNSVIDTSYVGYFSGQYNQSYTHAWEGQYNAQYSTQYEGAVEHSFTKAYVGQYIGSYTKEYAGQYEGAFTGYYTTQYEGAFLANYTGSYVGVYTKQYTKQWVAGYAGGYTKTYVGQYTGQYEGAFDQQWEGAFTGYYSTSYSHVWLGNYTKEYAGVYNKLYLKHYEGSYEGAFTGYFANSYTGIYLGQYTKQYEGSFDRQWEGSFDTQYTGYFTGTYIGYYEGVKQFTKAYEGNWTGTYLKHYVKLYEGSYTGVYAGDRTYTGQYVGYWSKAYIGSWTKTYVGQYSHQFTGTRTYTGQYTGYWSKIYLGVNYLKAYKSYTKALEHTVLNTLDTSLEPTLACTLSRMKDRDHILERMLAEQNSTLDTFCKVPLQGRMLVTMIKYMQERMALIMRTRTQQHIRDTTILHSQDTIIKTISNNGQDNGKVRTLDNTLVLTQHNSLEILLDSIQETMLASTLDNTQDTLVQRTLVTILE